MKGMEGMENYDKSFNIIIYCNYNITNKKYGKLEGMEGYDKTFNIIIYYNYNITIYKEWRVGGYGRIWHCFL